jgi:hypothetical protein
MGRTPKTISHLKSQNPQWEALRKEIVGPKPISSRTKQVVNEDGQKTPGRPPSLEETSSLATAAHCKIVAA